MDHLFFLNTIDRLYIRCPEAVSKVRRQAVRSPCVWATTLTTGAHMQEFTVRTTQQLPQLLQAFRKAAHLTQGEVATRLGVTQQTISALERNAETVSAARLMKLMNTLGVEWVLRTKPEAGAGTVVPDTSEDW